MPAEGVPLQSVSRRSRLLDRLFSRAVGVPAGLALLATFFGCMSLEIGRPRTVIEAPAADGVIEQTGTVTLHHEKAQTVYYPVPYAGTPNLTISNSSPFDEWELVEQKCDHFTVRRGPQGSPFARELTWTAKGLKGPPPPAPVAAAPPAEAALPPVPVPVGPARP